MAAHQAPPSLGFSRQEHWSALPFPSPVHESEKWKWSCSVVSDSSRPHGLQPTRLLHPWDFPGKSTGVGCHRLLWFTNGGRGQMWPQDVCMRPLSAGVGCTTGRCGTWRGPPLCGVWGWSFCPKVWAWRQLVGAGVLTPVGAPSVMKWSESCSVVSASLQPHGLYSPWNSPSQNTGVGSHPFLQGIFSTQGSNPGLPHCRWILYHLSHQGSPLWWERDEWNVPQPWCLIVKVRMWVMAPGEVHAGGGGHRKPASCSGTPEPSLPGGAFSARITWDRIPQLNVGQGMPLGQGRRKALGA